MLVLLPACDSAPTGPVIEEHPDIRPYVAGAASQALGSNGEFAIAADIIPALEQVPVTSAATAQLLASAFVKSYGPLSLPAWQLDRGATIHLASLTPSTRIYPLQTPYAAVPDIGCHPTTRRLYGSFYLMTLNEGVQAEIRMAVSAQLTDFSVDADGNLIEPLFTGSDFLHEGIRADGSVARLLSPEQAVALAARATGAKIVNVPQLVRRAVYTPNFALWRIELDRPVPVLAVSGQQLTTTVLFVGPNQAERFYVAALDQPSSVATKCPKLIDPETLDVTIAVAGGQPTVFTPVTPTR